MTILEQHFMESLPERMKGIEKELKEINLNLNDLCSSIGGLVHTLREMDPDYERKKQERERKLIEQMQGNLNL